MVVRAKPRKPTKGDPDSKWHQKRADLLKVFAYCIQDVRTERAVSEQLGIETVITGNPKENATKTMIAKMKDA